MVDSPNGLPHEKFLMIHQFDFVRSELLTDLQPPNTGYTWLYRYTYSYNPKK